MGDGFSDMRREERQARARQDIIDKFFDAVMDFLGPKQKNYTEKGVMAEFEKYDEVIYPRRGAANRSAERFPERAQYIGARLHMMACGDKKSWACLLAEAMMHASKKCFDRLHEVSPFAGSPIVVIVPNGPHREPQLLGDYRDFHRGLEVLPRTPFVCTAVMPERSIKGMRQTDDGWEEERVEGWDDIRFLSF